MKQHRWTASEARVVEELYEDHGSLGVSAVLPHIGRQAIRDMAKRLGLKARGKKGAGNRLAYRNANGLARTGIANGERA